MIIVAAPCAHVCVRGPVRNGRHARPLSSVVRHHQMAAPNTSHTANVIAALVTGVLMAIAMWASVSVRSINQWMGENDLVGEGFISLNYPSLVFGIIASGNAHSPAKWAMCLGAF